MIIAAAIPKICNHITHGASPLLPEDKTSRLKPPQRKVQFSSVREFDVHELLQLSTIMSVPNHAAKLCASRMSSDRPLQRCVNFSQLQHLRNALFDAQRQLSGTHYRKLFSVVTLLQFLSLG